MEAHLEGLEGGGRAFAVNLPGHPSGEISCRSIDEYAAAVRRFISEAGIERPVICGHSMGGAIALTLAVNYPRDVLGLILLDTGAKLGVLPSIREGLAENPLWTIERVITPLSFHKAAVELFRESRVTLSLPNLAIFLND